MPRPPHTGSSRWHLVVQAGDQKKFRGQRIFERLSGRPVTARWLGCDGPLAKLRKPIQSSLLHQGEVVRMKPRSDQVWRGTGYRLSCEYALRLMAGPRCPD